MPFSTNTLQFLLENRMHDSREWYSAHKGDYREYVIKPFTELIERLKPAMADIDPQIICTPRRISRLFRDARYLRGKSIFRDNVWCMFERPREEFPGYPGFYFEFSPNGFAYGCGYYHASAAVMSAMRTLILDNDMSFTEALKAYQNSPFKLNGEAFKKDRYPDKPPEVSEWLNKRDIWFSCDSGDFNLLFSDELWRRISDDFTAIAPIYRFFMKSEAITTVKE